MLDPMKKMYAIMGPTASGKSDFAIELAEMLGGEIINADSLQVYEDVPLLTARPTSKDMQRVPHHLYGFLDAFSKCNMAFWLEKVKEVLDSVAVPIFVGGTGLYFKALLDGFHDIPDIPPEVRTAVRQMPPEEIKSRLGKDAPADPQRMMRALEVLEATGKPLSYWHTQPIVKPIEGDFETILISPPKEVLYERCNQRFQKMINLGALAEVTHLLEKNPDRTGGVFQAIGVSELSDFLEEKKTLEEAIQKAAQATRNYAKRQGTWFRHQIKPKRTLTEANIKEYL